MLFENSKLQFSAVEKKHTAFNLLCPWSEKGSYLIRFIFQSTLKKLTCEIMF